MQFCVSHWEIYYFINTHPQACVLLFSDVRCGQLHCRNSGSFHLSISGFVYVLRQWTFVSSERANVLCRYAAITCIKVPHFYKLSRSFTTLPGADMMPGLVPDGAKCGSNRVNISNTLFFKVY